MRPQDDTGNPTRRAGLHVLLAVVLLLTGGRALLGRGDSPGAGFRGSPHDFSGESAGSNLRDGRQVTTGPCTFCHTPHRSYTSRLAWNHTLSTNTFSWKTVTRTAGGTPLPVIRPGWTGPTEFCLSCHDGTVAIGDIGWFNRRSWTGASNLNDTKHDSGSKNIASTSGDMRANHPVALPYPYMGIPSTYNQSTTGSGVSMQAFRADPTGSGIRLFNDASGVVVGTPVAGRTGIECTSCHGVHNERGLVQDSRLLRGSRNDGEPNYICSKCHTQLLKTKPHD